MLFKDRFTIILFIFKYLCPMYKYSIGHVKPYIDESRVMEIISSTTPFRHNFPVVRLKTLAVQVALTCCQLREPLHPHQNTIQSNV